MVPADGPAVAPSSASPGLEPAKAVSALLLEGRSCRYITVFAPIFGDWLFHCFEDDHRDIHTDSNLSEQYLKVQQAGYRHNSQKPRIFCP